MLQNCMRKPFYLRKKIICSNPILGFTVPISRPLKEVTHFPKMFLDYLLQCSFVQIHHTWVRVNENLNYTLKGMC